MATVLSDRDIKRLIGSVIKDAQPSLINPNGIELRLGNRARFISTGEECEIPTGSFLQIRPGESIVFASLVSLDFSRETISRVFPGVDDDGAHNANYYDDAGRGDERRN